MKSFLKFDTMWFFVIVAFIPILILRTFTPENEMRYLTIANEALREGHFFSFTLNGVPYADKPPLYIWIVMLCRWLTGGYQMIYLSLFSFIPAIWMTKIINDWMAEEMDAGHRLTACLMLMSCGLFVGAAFVVRMDMLMSFFILLALRSFWRMYQKYSPKENFLFALWVFLAIFTKGPLGLLIPVVGIITFLVLKKQTRFAAKCFGWRFWLILVVACGLWFTATYLEGGPDYINNLLFHQTVGRAVNSFHHNRPFYYYLISVLYAWQPWTLLMIGAMGVALYRRVYLTDLQRFFFSIVFSSIVLLSLISGKLAIYLLPAFPFAVFLSASLIARFEEEKWAKILALVPAFLFCFSIPVIILLSKLSGMQWLNNVSVYFASGALTLMSGKAIYEARHHTLSQTLQLIAYGVLMAIFFIGLSMPAINPSVKTM
ncbi:MAG: hypothetical protein LKG25_00655 [Prevotella sp.]|jgi:4-amino-4-deoxy-L-arabinose transferase-like glycosyltransferase|nr:hypothetical protein [Prevotella sp.]MCI1281087.1 hypothetical protein [Prevotella sp.]